MAKYLLLSKNVLWNELRQAPYDGVREAVKACSDAGHVVAVVSNHVEPPWLKPTYPGVTFLNVVGRQSGEFLRNVLVKLPQFTRLDFLAVGSSLDDLRMATNAGIVLLNPAWGQQQTQYGVVVRDPQELAQYAGYYEETETPWYFESEPNPSFEVKVLTNAGFKGQPNKDTEKLGDRLRTHLKGVGHHVNGFLLLHLLSSVYKTPALLEGGKDCIWSFYPSSQSPTDDAQLMARYSKATRESLGKRLVAKQGEPLLIRSRKSTTRHSATTNRLDPTEQLQTVHVNPFYRGKLRRRTAYILDDFMTYGVSFSVAAALLRAAGAKKTLGVAMGQFGSAARRFEIEVTGDPFGPLRNSDFTLGAVTSLSGKTHEAAILSTYEKYKS